MRVRIFMAAITAVFLFATVGTITSYAKDDRLGAIFIESDVDSYELFYANADSDTVPPSITPVTEEASATQPLTPSGTGTVIDNIINESGIEFFTITSTNDNVFFLIIDRQRDTKNVYFLNAVTERDLLALAEQSGEDMDAWSHLATPPPIIPDTPTIPTIAESEVELEPVLELEQNSNIGTAVLLTALALGGGASGYYFKIYRPKQQQVDLEDDFDYEDDYSDGVDFYDDRDDNPPWYTEDDENKGGDE